MRAAQLCSRWRRACRARGGPSRRARVGRRAGASRGPGRRLSAVHPMAVLRVRRADASAGGPRGRTRRAMWSGRGSRPSRDGAARRRACGRERSRGGLEARQYSDAEGIVMRADDQSARGPAHAVRRLHLRQPQRDHLRLRAAARCARRRARWAVAVSKASPPSASAPICAPSNGVGRDVTALTLSDGTASCTTDAPAVEAPSVRRQPPFGLAARAEGCTRRMIASRRRSQRPDAVRQSCCCAREGFQDQCSRQPPPRALLPDGQATCLLDRGGRLDSPDAAVHGQAQCLWCRGAIGRPIQRRHAVRS